MDMALAATRSELVHEDGDVAPGSSASPNSWGSRLRARIPCDAAVRTEVSSLGRRSAGCPVSQLSWAPRASGARKTPADFIDFVPARNHTYSRSG